MIGVVGQTAAWSLVFFFASAAASSAYLTVGESFPIEIRALAIALFYAFGTAIGGVAGPWLFGELIGTGERVVDFLGLRTGRGPDAGGGGYPVALGTGCRTPLAGGHRGAAVPGGLSVLAMLILVAAGGAASSPGCCRSPIVVAVGGAAAPAAVSRGMASHHPAPRADYVRHLPADLQLQLKKHMQVFLAEKDFIGCDGLR